jgi:hypothetical protein
MRLSCKLKLPTLEWDSWTCGDCFVNGLINMPIRFSSVFTVFLVLCESIDGHLGSGTLILRLDYLAP